ncbi:MAG: hypothetical protein H0X51_02555 [Parachlamydiaceae bacterium]|nr:hypothetical protein [Parachlamydiaceae bacterium]
MARFLRLMQVTLLLGALSLTAEEPVVVLTPAGNSLTLEVDPQDSFANVMAHIEQEIQIADETPDLDLSQSLQLNFFSPIAATRAPAGRNYAEAASPSEAKDIRTIVTSLAKYSWAQLMNHKSSIKKAGDRVDHVHPLRFLACIFNDEEMKGCVHAIRDRSRIYKEFTSGLFGSLDTEARNGNLEQFVPDFARSLNLDGNAASALSSVVQKRQWDNLIDTLMKFKPRSGNPGRYDM